MVGHYLGEFSVSYKPVKHGRPGVRTSFFIAFFQLTILKQIGATHCKLFLEFTTCVIHQFLLLLFLHSISLVRSIMSVSALGAYIFSASPSSNCTHLYFPYTITSTAQKKLCFMRSSHVVR